MEQPVFALFRTLGQDLFDFIYPGYCYLCKQHLDGPERFICPACLGKIPILPGPFCPSCKEFILNLKPEHSFGTFIDCVYSLWSYDEAAGTLIHKFKYESKTSLGEKLGQQLAHQVRSKGFLSEIDLVIPVPLHPARKRERGFNQSEVIARQVAHICGIELAEMVLKRYKNTRDQTLLSGPERKINVLNAFRTSGETELTGKNILLVDDVVTTGATLNECARTLLASQANRVYACTLAVAV